MRTTFAIAGVELRRFFKDRSNVFFALVFPLLIVLLIGAQFGGGSNGRIALVGPDSALRAALAAELEDEDIDVTIVGADDMRELVARGRADVGVLFEDEAAAAYDNGSDLRLEVIPGAQAQSQVMVQQVSTAAQNLTTELGQVIALTAAAGIDADAARTALGFAQAVVSPPRLEVVNTSEIAQEFSGLGRFDYGAGAEVILFVFLTSLSGSATLIQSRRLGVTRRTLAAPVSTAQAVGGQVIGRLAIATFQGAYIMAASSLLFGVRWGNLALALLVVVVFALVAAGAAMVLGSVIDNDAAAGGIGVGLALVLAALGGGMVPLQLFPDTLRTIAHVTPHAWASEALAEIQRHNGTLVDILPQLGVLLAFAVVLLVLGSWALRRSLARAI